MVNVKYDICYVNGTYEICYYQDLSKFDNIDLVEKMEKFAKKVSKYKEIVGNKVILDILRHENIVVDNLSIDNIKSVVNALKNKHKKIIKIEPIKPKCGGAIYSTTENGDFIYLTSEKYATYLERISLCQV